MTYRGVLERTAGEVVTDISDAVEQFGSGEEGEGQAEDTGMTAEDRRKARAQANAAKKRIGFADSLAFNGFIGVVIVVNLIFIGLEQDYGPPPLLNADGSPAPPMENIINNRLSWYACEFMFTLIFFLELIIRLRAYRWAYFKDAWNDLDFILVSLAVLDTWVLSLTNLGAGEVRMFSTLRVLRMLRLVRFVRLMRMFQELWLLVAGLMNSMRTLGWVALLLGIVLYVFGIFMTMMVGQNPSYGYPGEPILEVCPTCPDKRMWPYKVYFGQVTASMLTLFQVATLDSWADEIARPVMSAEGMSWMGLVFMFFIMLSTFGILNIVVGVIVENTLGTAQATDKVVAQERSQKKRKVLESLKKLFELTDADGSGTLSREELGAALTIPEVAEKFQSLGLPMMDVNLMFELMDPGGDGNISLEDFMSACTQLLGDMGQKDIMQLAMQVESLNTRMNMMEGALRQIEADSDDTKQLTLRFMQQVVPKLVGNAVGSVTREAEEHERAKRAKQKK